MLGFQLLCRDYGWPLWNDRPKVYLDKLIGGWNDGTGIDLSYSMQSTHFLVAGCSIESNGPPNGAVRTTVEEAGCRVKLHDSATLISEVSSWGCIVSSVIVLWRTLDMQISLCIQLQLHEQSMYSTLHQD